MRVVTFNLHAGVNGWGCPTDVEEVLAGIDADLYILPELWRDDAGTDMPAALTARGLHGVFVPMAEGYRVTTGPSTRTWQPLSAHLTGEYGLYFDTHRPLKTRQRRRRARYGDGTPGTWGLGLYARTPLSEIRLAPLPRQPREKVTRTLIIARVHSPLPCTVMAIHGGHLSHGSRHHYREVTRLARDIEGPVLLAGDFNSWRPVLRLLLPGWRTLARKKTWPARFPHAQIDHILGRGPWRSHHAHTIRAGSDHRALLVDLELPLGFGHEEQSREGR